jgi:hypothetical protein
MSFLDSMSMSRQILYKILCWPRELSNYLMLTLQGYSLVQRSISWSKPLSLSNSKLKVTKYLNKKTFRLRLKNIFKDHDKDCVEYEDFFGFCDYFSNNGKKGIEKFIENIENLIEKYPFEQKTIDDVNYTIGCIKSSLIEEEEDEDYLNADIYDEVKVISQILLKATL